MLLQAPTVFFSCQLDEEQRRLLGEPSRKQIIFEAENTVCRFGLQLVGQEHDESKEFFSMLIMKVRNFA